MDGMIIILLASVLIIGGLLFAVITFSKKGPASLNVERYRVKWLSIEQQLMQNEVSSYHLSVMNADKLLDQALRDRGVKGNTMGERMKTVQQSWSNANAVWGAHKLRNQIAHEPDVSVSYADARRALTGFKQALKDVGAI